MVLGLTVIPASAAERRSDLACSRVAAGQLVPRVGFNGQAVGQLVCADLAADELIDMAFTMTSPGSAGVIGWAAFKATTQVWSLLTDQKNAYRPQLVRVDGDLIEVTPVYLARDPNCCPSGGARDREFHWNGSHFVVRYRWTQNP
jgi:hypothetical protein